MSTVQPEYALFNDLVQRAKESNGSPDTLTRLYHHLFTLDHWYFACKPLATKTPELFIGQVGGQGWYMVFTDITHALEFAKRNGLVYPNGNASVIKIPTDKCMKTLVSNPQITGVRFNEGNYGWYSPIATLPDILEHVMKTASEKMENTAHQLEEMLGEAEAQAAADDQAQSEAMNAEEYLNPMSNCPKCAKQGFKWLRNYCSYCGFQSDKKISPQQQNTRKNRDVENQKILDALYAERSAMYESRKQHAHERGSLSMDHFRRMQKPL